MKIGLFTVFVCIFTLSLGSDEDDYVIVGEEDGTYRKLPIMEYLLTEQYEKTQARIFDAMTQCNERWSIPYKESIELFQALPQVLPRPNRRNKCFIACVMRKQHLLTAKGFQVNIYLKQFKQLRFNYTSEAVEDPIPKKQLFDAINRFDVTKANYNLIQTVERAAQHCKDTKDPKNDVCETAWSIVTCVINYCRDMNFNLPFYPPFIVPVPFKKLARAS